MAEGKKKILVLMSGGVDSSVSAALLKNAGHDVAGVYLKLWDPGSQSGIRNYESGIIKLGDPCWAKEMQDAARVAAHLNIPFSVWDVTEDYKKRVLQNFYAEYAAGRTPNPDVLCNSEIKFGIGLEKALAAGYDYVATGHYARVHNPPHLPSPGLRPPSPRGRGEGEGMCQLWAAVDNNKDQSYFLWQLTQEQLRHIMFPIGEYTKPQVRELAKKFGLHNADKKDSQGVCFLGKIKLTEFLYVCHPDEPRGDEGSLHRVREEEIPHCVRNDIVRVPGQILDVHGNLLGYHDGLAHFTIGQRHGTKLGGTGPYFVVEKDLATSTLVVANEMDEPEYRAVRCQVLGIRCQVDIPAEGLKCQARVRYRGELMGVTVSGDRVIFDIPARAVTPGQSIVFYQDDRMIGGGIIDEVVLLNRPVLKYPMTNAQCPIKS